MKKTRFTSFDGKELTCFLWDDAVNPKGVIQLVHGLTSHTSRYAEFAPRLNAAGYLVFGDDHRMNGHTAGLENLGIAGPTTFDDNVADELAITKNSKGLRSARSVVCSQLRFVYPLDTSNSLATLSTGFCSAVRRIWVVACCSWAVFTHFNGSRG